MEGKGPGFQCLHMRLIAVEFHRHCGPSMYVCTIMMSKQMRNITWSTHLPMYHSSKYSMRDLDHAFLIALQWLTIPEVILILEPQPVIVKFACSHLPGLGSHYASKYIR